MNTTIYTNLKNGTKYELIGTLDKNAESVRVRKADGTETNLKVAYVTDPTRYSEEVVDLPEAVETPEPAKAPAKKKSTKKSGKADTPKVDRAAETNKFRSDLLEALKKAGFEATQPAKNHAERVYVKPYADLDVFNGKASIFTRSAYVGTEYGVPCGYAGALDRRFPFKGTVTELVAEIEKIKAGKAKADKAKAETKADKTSKTKK